MNLVLLSIDFENGHTFGHAIEASTDFKVPHGIAVAFGMDLANILSFNLGYISLSTRNEFLNLINLVIEDYELPNFSMSDYHNSLKKDKKNIGKEINCILTKGRGKMFKTKLELDNSTKSLIEKFFSEKTYRKAL